MKCNYRVHITTLLVFSSLLAPAQNLSVSAGMKYGLNVTGKLSKRETNSYNFVQNNDVADFDAGIYFDTRYRFHKRRNWHVSVFGEFSTLHYRLRMLDLKLSGEEHSPIKMNFQRFTFGFGIHKYFTLYDGRLFLDIGVQFQFRNYFQDEKTYGTLDIDAPSNPGPVPVQLYELTMEHKTETKIESFNFAPDLLIGIKYPINNKTLFNIGAQLSFPHFVYTENDYRYQYLSLESSIGGYGLFNFSKLSSTFSFLYLNMGISRIIIKEKKDSFKGL